MLIFGFEHFDPLKGLPPETFPEYGKDIIARARNLLLNRTDGEIYKIVGFINWLIEESPAKEHSERRLNLYIKESDTTEKLSKDELEFLERDTSSSTYALKAFQTNISLPIHDEILNLSWDEIFAVLALSLIDKTIDDEKYYRGWAHDEITDWMYEWRILSHSSYWLIEAMDAIATAEGFRKTEEQISTSKEKISLRNIKANIHRHAKTNEAILAFDKFYDPIKHKSVRNAAKKFSETHPEKLKHLSEDNHLRTLSNGLSQYRKGLRRTLQDS